MEQIRDTLSADRSAVVRRRVVQACKAFVTITLLCIVFWYVDLDAFWDVAVATDRRWLALAFAAYSLMLLTSTWKWKLLLDSVDVAKNFRSLLNFYTIGFFFSSILPGSIGGDVVRWHATSSTTVIRVRVAATILAERITGLIMLVALCALLTVAHRRELATIPVLIALAAATGGLCVGVWLARDATLSSKFFGRTRGRVRAFTNTLHKLHRGIAEIPAGALRAAIINSLPFYASAALFFYLVALSVDADITYLEAASVQFLISLITLVPVSLGGLGLAQVADVYLLGLFGVDAPTALAMSLLRQGARYLYAAFGALLFWLWPGHSNLSNLRDSGNPDTGAVSTGDSRLK